MIEINTYLFGYVEHNTEARFFNYIFYNFLQYSILLIRRGRGFEEYILMGSSLKIELNDRIDFWHSLYRHFNDEMKKVLQSRSFAFKLITMPSCYGHTKWPKCKFRPMEYVFENLCLFHSY